MHLPVTRIMLWVPVGLQILLIAAACLRPRLIALAAMACSGLTVVTMFAALTVANLGAVLAAFSAMAAFTIGIWAMVVAVQRSPLVPPAANEPAAGRLVRFLQRQCLPLAAATVHTASWSLDRSRVVRLDIRAGHGPKRSGRR
jgi:hypothetical protein